jgi:DNA-binding response OmpR family regulator
MMPKMNGYQVCRHIRNDTQLTQQPHIIILTVKGREIDEGTAKEAGANEFIIKPFSPSRVIARVKEVLA